MTCKSLNALGSLLCISKLNLDQQNQKVSCPKLRLVLDFLFIYRQPLIPTAVTQGWGHLSLLLACQVNWVTRKRAETCEAEMHIRSALTSKPLKYICIIYYDLPHSLIPHPIPTYFWTSKGGTEMTKGCVNRWEIKHSLQAVHIWTNQDIAEALSAQSLACSFN